MAISTSALAILAASLVSAIGANAQATDIYTCKDASCTGTAGNCFTTFEEGTGGVCTQFDKSSFDGNGFPLNEAGGYDVYFNIPQAETGCQHIVYTGSSVNNCGIVAGTFTQPTCARIAVNSMMAMEYCCGDGCAQQGNRVAAAGILPNVTSVHKRDCSSFTTRQGPYTKDGGAQSVSDPVSGPAQVAISASVTVGRSTTFSASVGDPYGIVSASTGVEFSESVTNELSYTFEVLEGQTGYVAWTPQLTCVEGVLSGCDSGSDTSGEVCGPRTGSDGAVVGQYSFVLSSRTAAKEGERKPAMRFRY
ncbi:hypothetical protein BJY04DRAFT_224477 [Aspergillus karnatakaensis]|uniref:uncharacterized protein n=1 Tax=Aspergillus karnatakaensis TaxID=1810916 RepID=UPI003CCCE88D